MPERISAKKRLGQHFLHDKPTIKLITSDFSSLAEAIIEIGPGPLTLTRGLKELNLPLIAVEKDKSLTAIISSLLSKDEIIFQDALEVDLTNLISERGWVDKKIWLVSNLPYNVSVPLLISFLKTKKILYMTLMFQKEVGDRILIRRDGESEMSSLMALTNSFFDVKLLKIVSKGAFTPPPKVTSTVLSFVRKENPLIPYDRINSFETFIKKLFGMPRKQIQAVLKRSEEVERTTKILKKLNIDEKRRASTLSLNEVVSLYNLFQDE